MEKIIEYIKKNEDIENYLSSYCDVDFESQELLEDDLNFLLECGKCNYKLKPFAYDGCGGIYAILNNKKVGYIDSEGNAGIVANNIRDFFSIVTNIGNISDLSHFNCSKDKERFVSYFYEVKNEIPRDKKFVKDFIKENLLEDNPEKIYVLLKNAITSEPKLIIEATSEDFEDSEQLFEF